MTYTLSPALRLVLSQLESAATARAEAYRGAGRMSAKGYITEGIA